VDASGGQYEGSWQGIYSFKNGLGFSMALGIVTLLVIALRTTGSQRLCVFGAIALCSVLIIGAHSATAVVILLLVSGILALALLWRSKRRRGIALATTLIAALALVASVVDSDPLLGLLGRDASFTGRDVLWTVAESAIQDHPLLGYGYGVFWVENGPYVDHIAQTTTDFWLPPDGGSGAHNGFLQIALDVGLVGASLVVLMLLYGTWRAARYVVTGPDVSSVWPFLVIATFICGNLTECGIAIYNDWNWIIFVAVLLYLIMPERRLLDDPCLSDRKVVFVPGGLYGS
jgi:exopolysaccharide production protein ExoQ